MIRARLLATASPRPTELGVRPPLSAWTNGSNIVATRLAGIGPPESLISMLAPVVSDVTLTEISSPP